MAFAFGDDDVCRPAFDSKPTPRVSYGLRFPEACAKHCEHTFNSRRVYIICSRSLAANTTSLQRLRDALGDRVAGVRNGISPHTPIAEVVEAIVEARQLNVDCIVTLGAGSLTDAAKLVRLGLANNVTSEEDMDSLWGTTQSNPALRKDMVRPSIPLIHIPTSLSGGEYQAIAGGTESAARGHAKHTFQPHVDPELVVQDPELCLTTPQWVWLSTGIRSVDHCVETLCSLQSNAKGDERAAAGLTALVPGLLDSKAAIDRDNGAAGPASLDARFRCMQGVVDAMCAVSTGVPLGASHAIGHQLGPLGVGHGETSCILLPAVCKYNLEQEANVDRQAFVRDLLLRQDQVRALLDARGLDAATVDLGDILYAIIGALGMPQSLEAAGVGRDKFESLAKNSLNDIWIRTNAVAITETSQVMAILEKCAYKK
ncbi:maleylacetate reductase [Microdochium nivale]|nr:maleylacetate reductase [Microdochium nivale]